MKIQLDNARGALNKVVSRVDVQKMGKMVTASAVEAGGRLIQSSGKALPPVPVLER